MKKIFLTSFFIALGAYSFALAGGETPGSYSNYQFNTTSGLQAVDFSVTVNKDPGYMANTFWSNEFGLSGSTSGAYTGMQTNGGNERTFLFSIWDGIASKVGSPGSYCVKFNEDGTGYSCRMHYNWKAGHTYQFHTFYHDNNWLSVIVTDLQDKTSFTLGSIQTSFTTISPSGMGSWVEYFEWSNSRSTCLGQPYSNATFGAAVGYDANQKAYPAKVISTNTSGTCQNYTKISIVNTPPLQASIHENGIGNSARGHIKNNQLCLNASGGLNEGTNIVTYSCNNGTSEGWVYSKDHSLETEYDYCLVDDNGLKLETCGKKNVGSQWEIKNNEIKKANTSLCLTNDKNGGNVTLTECNHSTNQQWDVPELGLSNK